MRRGVCDWEEAFTCHQRQKHGSNSRLWRCRVVLFVEFPHLMQNSPFVYNLSHRFANSSIVVKEYRITALGTLWAHHGIVHRLAV